MLIISKSWRDEHFFLFKFGNKLKNFEEKIYFESFLFSDPSNSFLEKKEFILSKQFLRSATSIGANIEEAIGGQSNADFISKISISYKESRETVYWIKLMKETVN